MAVRLPIVLAAGQLEQLQAGDTLPSAPALLAWSQAEVDFGAVPVRQATFTVVDATVLATSKIIAQQSGEAATGRQADENEMDQLRIVPRATLGNLVLYVTGADGQPLSGKYRVNYGVG